MSSSVLITVPDELVDDFVNHLGRLKPDIAKHITIRVLDNALNRVIEEFDKPLDHTGGHKTEDYEAWQKIMDKIEAIYRH